MKTVNEVSKMTGVSVRTLHHYDAIDLLKPTKLTDAGYRLYDDTALERLQNILLFRELQFPLKEIKAILDSPDFDSSEALAQQIMLLELQYQHLGELISFAREIQQNQQKGVTKMNFDVFDKSEMEQYKEEARKKWGGTKEYQEYAEKEKSGQNFDAAGAQLMTLLADIGALRHLAPSDQAVQDKIRTLQNFITDNFYTCTDEILFNLGQMYISDERFQRNIDRAGGPGTAEFVSQAIAAIHS